jgi:predicted Zn-dependent peptidase
LAASGIGWIQTLNPLASTWVSDRGGSSNGLTYDDHTAYYVHLPGEHAEFAIEWLWKVLSPHAMEPGVVTAEREPIALEIDARERELGDHVNAWFFNPYFMYVPGFWEREFGIATYALRDYDPWRSLHSIDSADLLAFYERYYVPSRMILSVSGDIEPEHMLELVRATFGTLPERERPPPLYDLSDPARAYEDYLWDRRASVWFRIIYKLYEPTAEDVLTAMFVGRFLDDRLTDLLRRSEDKAVYGLSVGSDQRGPAVGFQIQANIREDLYAFARATIEGEIESLRNASHDAELFTTLRDSIAKQLATGVSEPADIVGWRNASLYNPDIFDDLPDVHAVMRDMTQERASEWVSRAFVPERRVLDVIYPLPVPSVALWIGGFVLGGLTYAFARRRFVRPIEMRRLRYVARMRVSPLYALVAGGIDVAVIAVIGRVAVWLWSLAYTRWVRPVDCFWIQYGVAAVGLVIVVGTILWILTLIPRKVLLLEDELRIKSLLFRSRILRPADVAVVELRSFRDVWPKRSIVRCIPLTLGLFQPAIYLETTGGRSYFFRARERDELVELLRGFAPATSSS